MDAIRPTVGGTVVLALGFSLFTAVHLLGSTASTDPAASYVPTPAQGSLSAPDPSASVSDPSAPAPDLSAPAPAATDQAESAAPAQSRPTESTPAQAEATKPRPAGSTGHREARPSPAPNTDPSASRLSAGVGRDQPRSDQSRSGQSDEDQEPFEDQMVSGMCGRGDLPPAYCAKRSAHDH